MDRVALAYWTKCDFRDHYPSPKPDGGVKETGITLTKLVAIPAIQAVLTEYNLGRRPSIVSTGKRGWVHRSLTHSTIETSFTLLQTLVASPHVLIVLCRVRLSWSFGLGRQMQDVTWGARPLSPRTPSIRARFAWDVCPPTVRDIAP